MKRFASVSLLVLALGLLPAFAGALLSDSLTVFNPAGAIFAQIQLFEDGSLVCTGGCAQTGPGDIGEDPNSLYYLTDTSLVDPAQFGNPTQLLEAGGTSFSDIFGVATFDAGTTFVFGFASDTDSSPALLAGSAPITLPEGNGLFDATMYLNPRLSKIGYTAQFFSDPEVPEPGTLGMLLGGALSLSALALLKRARA